MGKSVSLRSRARAHFCAPAGWTEKAEIVDYRPTNSELGALVLENRLIKSWKPAGNVKLKRTDRYCYLRCRLDIPYPVLEVAAEPAPGNAVNVGPLGSRALAGELADQLTSLYRLRHCGRKLKVREHPSAYGQMGRCVSPCLGDLDPNAPASTRPGSVALRAAGRRPGADHEIDRRSAEARPMRATSAPRLCCAGRAPRVGDERLEGVLRATHWRPRLCSRAIRSGRFDSFWSYAAAFDGGRSRASSWWSAPNAQRPSAGTTVVPADEVDGFGWSRVGAEQSRPACP